MAVIKMKCNCGMIIESNVGDSIYNNNLRWYQTYCCDNCGNAMEMDGIGDIPSEIKKAIMMQEGSYGLFSSDLKNRNKIIYLLKKMPYKDLDLFDLFKEGKSDEIIRGTQNEVTFIKDYLVTKGVKSCKVKLLLLNQSSY